MIPEESKMAYTIMISEEQRLALVEVLKAADVKWTTGPRQGGGTVEEAPLEYWVDMLEDLPHVEKNGDRGMVHGFCL